MLKRVHIKGYKSLADVEVELQPLSVLFGLNATGKSNFLDALRLLSKIVTGRNLREAFEPPHRGKPIESFALGPGGVEGLARKNQLKFSIEVDLRLSDTVVDAVERQIRKMRPSNGKDKTRKAGRRPRTSPARVRERDLRYRVEIEMLPRAGALRVSDEYLTALNGKGEPSKSRKAFIERRKDKMYLRREGQAHQTCYGCHMDQSILSMPHHPPHYPHLMAARQEMEGWHFYCFEPRGPMRAANSLEEVRHIGFAGEGLAAYLNTLKVTKPGDFKGIEGALNVLVPEVDGIEVDVNDFGEVELRLKENGVTVPTRVLSEGTLRMLGILSINGARNGSALIGLEEPENGVHPRQLEWIAEILKTQEIIGRTQYLVTTHSSVLPDLVPEESLFVVCREDGRTRIDPFSAWGPIARRSKVDGASKGGRSRLAISQRILRGDFDA